MKVIQDREKSFETLAKHPFLADLAQPYLDYLADQAWLAKFEADEHLLIEGEVAQNFYLIHEGEVVLRTFLSPSQGFADIQRLKNGEILGWSWLVPPHYWHFSAFACTPTTVIAVDGRQLREKCRQDHDFGYELQSRLMFIIGQRLRSTRRQLR
jgi:CRP-like cAMP-binding protein